MKSYKILQYPRESYKIVQDPMGRGTGVGKELDDGRSPGCSSFSPESPEVCVISGGNKNDSWTASTNARGLFTIYNSWKQANSTPQTSFIQE